MIRRLKRTLTGILAPSGIAGSFVRRALMAWRKARHGNPTTVPALGDAALAAYGNGMQWRAIRSFPAREGVFSEAIFDWAKKNAERKARVVFDIGANIGLYVLALKQIDPKLQIVAFEPDKKNFELLQKNCEYNKLNKVASVNKAVGANNNIVFGDAGASGSASFSLGDDAGKGGEKFELITIDQIVKAKDFPPPDALLVDVEGFEYDVLVGARETLIHHSPILFLEIHHALLAARGRTIFDLFEFVSSFDYECTVLRTPTGKTGEHRQFHAVFRKRVLS